VARKQHLRARPPARANQQTFRPHPLFQLESIRVPCGSAVGAWDSLVQRRQHWAGVGRSLCLAQHQRVQWEAGTGQAPRTATTSANVAVRIRLANVGVDSLVVFFGGLQKLIEPIRREGFIFRTLERKGTPVCTRSGSISAAGLGAEGRSTFVSQDRRWTECDILEWRTRGIFDVVGAAQAGGLVLQQPFETTSAGGTHLPIGAFTVGGWRIHLCPGSRGEACGCVRRCASADQHRFGRVVCQLLGSSPSAQPRCWSTQQLPRRRAAAFGPCELVQRRRRQFDRGGARLRADRWLWRQRADPSGTCTRAGRRRRQRCDCAVAAAALS